MLKAAHIRRFKGIEDVIIEDCDAVNAFYGRNNSGKSTILHALDMAGLALSTGNWNQFQPKLEIKDMFHEVGPFEIELTYEDGRHLTVRQQIDGSNPTFDPQPAEEQKFRSVYIIPDPGLGLTRPRATAPITVMQHIDSRNFSDINGLDILYALKHYAQKSQRGFQNSDYQQIIDAIQRFFPEIEQITSELTEANIPTLTYCEYGTNRDLIYAGAGLKHFVDIFVKVVLSRASVVLIDEPEMGLHPSLQRELLAHLLKLNHEIGIQFFIAAHSPVFLSNPEKVALFVMQNQKGQRSAVRVSEESLYTVWSDLGIRPGDLLQNDITVLVEGQSDVIFFENILELYREDLRDMAVGVVQYGGDSALGIIDGTINVKNIVPGNSFRLWIRDRHRSPQEPPESNSTRFKHALEENDEKCHILKNREIEYYFPQAAHIEAQQGDKEKEHAVLKILCGNQCAKFKELVHEGQCTLVKGNNLRKLLKKHLTRDNLDPEIKRLVERKLVPMARQIRGEVVNAKQPPGGTGTK